MTASYHPMPGVPRDTRRRIGLLGGCNYWLEVAVDQAGCEEVFAEVLEDGGVCRRFDATSRSRRSGVGSSDS